MALTLKHPLGTEDCSSPSCDRAVYLDTQHFLDLWESLFPPSYLDGLKSPGPGYEVLKAYAEVGRRLSLAVARLDCGAHILDSFAAALSNGYVQFTRANNSVGDTTIRAGTIVSTSNGNRKYITLTDVAFTGAALGPLSVQIAAVLPGWEFNVPGLATAADGEALPGEVDTVAHIDAFLSPSGERFLNSPPFAVTNALPICGGRPPMLDGLGLDRGIIRSDGETDDLYKNRIRQLPDTVSPFNLRRAINAAFALYGYSIGAGIDLIETWNPAYQTAFDVTGTIPLVNTNLFCYDDPRDPSLLFFNRWYGEEDFRGAFIVVVPNIGAIADCGMAFDDTATGPTAISPDTGGVRAISAYDVPSTLSIHQGGYDGFDLVKVGVYKGLYDLLDRIKAGGVFFAVELRGE